MTCRIICQIKFETKKKFEVFVSFVENMTSLEPLLHTMVVWPFFSRYLGPFSGVISLRKELAEVHDFLCDVASGDDQRHRKQHQ